MSATMSTKYAVSILIAFLCACTGVVCLQAQSLPPVFSLDYEALKQVREAVQNKDPRFTPAFETLQKNANNALQTQPISVTHKKGKAPSGDPHDYISIGIYWWPNPNTKNGLPYIQKDGMVNPEAEDETFDWQRGNRMTDAVFNLAFAYFLTGHEPYAEHAAKLLRVFFLDAETRMNPHLNYGQSIPGINQGRGIGTIETANWIRLIDAIGMLQESPAWTQQDQQAMVQWFKEYLDWLLNSKIGKEASIAANNIGTWYDAQVLCYALFTGQIDLVRQYKEKALNRLLPQIAKDGSLPHEVKRTQSWGYTMYWLEAAVNVAQLARHVDPKFPYREDKGRSIRKAMDFAFSYMERPNEWPYKNIGHMTPGSALNTYLPVAISWFNDPSYIDQYARLHSQINPKDTVRLRYPFGEFAIEKQSAPK
jgi:hypothetical protein